MQGIEQQYILQIINTIESLADNSFLSQCRKLRGAENLYRIQIGEHRVIPDKTKKKDGNHLIYRYPSDISINDGKEGISEKDFIEPTTSTFSPQAKVWSASAKDRNPKNIQASFEYQKGSNTLGIRYF